MAPLVRRALVTAVPPAVARVRLPSGLPFGAVMATGAASQLAGPSGVDWLTAPLLWLTVAETVAIPLLGSVRRRSQATRQRSEVRLLREEEHFGLFSVPVGLAVVATGLTSQSGGVDRFLAALFLVLAWVATLGLAGRLLVVTRAGRGPALAAVEGAWFLATAALLALAVATAAISSQHVGTGGLWWVALVACGLGLVGYGAVLVLAVLRALRTGLAGTARAAWWISAGCGGLAAAALGRVSQTAPAGIRLDWLPGFRWAATASWSIAALLLLVIVPASLRFLWARRRPGFSPPWPPTFSAGVFALGALQVGRLQQAAPITRLGDVVAGVTLGLWTVTAALHVAGVVAPVSRRRELHAHPHSDGFDHVTSFPPGGSSPAK